MLFEVRYMNQTEGSKIEYCFKVEKFSNKQEALARFNLTVENTVKARQILKDADCNAAIVASKITMVQKSDGHRWVNNVHAIWEGVA